MVVDHAVDLAVAGEDEREAESEAVERRAPRAEAPHPRGCCAETAQLVLVLRRLERDVVAEPLRLLVGIGVAPDVHEERGVVHDCALLVVEPDPLRDPEGDEALAEHVLHRLPEPEIDAERQRGDELGQTDGRTARLADPDARLGAPGRQEPKSRTTGSLGLRR